MEARQSELGLVESGGTVIYDSEAWNLTPLSEAMPASPREAAVDVADSKSTAEPFTYADPLLADEVPEVDDRAPKRSGKIRRAIGALAAGVASVTGVSVISSANAAASPASTAGIPANAILMDGQPWMIKDNDLKVIGDVGSFEWIGCGLTTAPLTAANYTPCEPGQDPIYTSEASLASAIASGELPAGSTIIYDPETWKYTPTVEQQNPIKYGNEAVGLARSNHITIIATPYAPTESAMITEEVADAKAGATVVEVQAQTARNSANFKALVNKARKAIHAANPNTIILAGMATDNGGRPNTVHNMYEEYKGVKGVVNGFWLNANTWGSGKGCAPQGCPVIARDFLSEIGAE